MFEIHLLDSFDLPVAIITLQEGDESIGRMPLFKIKKCQLDDQNEECEKTFVRDTGFDEQIVPNVQFDIDVSCGNSEFQVFLSGSPILKEADRPIVFLRDDPGIKKIKIVRHPVTEINEASVTMRKIVNSVYKFSMR